METTTARSAVVNNYPVVCNQCVAVDRVKPNPEEEAMTTLEELLKNHPIGRFCIKTQRIAPDVHIIIHPDGVDGETLDYVVVGNELIPLLDMTKDV